MKPVPGYPDLLVSECGEVFTTRYRGRLPKGRPAKAVQRRLRTHPDRDGYLRVYLTLDGRIVERGVHNLVCRAYHGEPPSPSHEAQHKDGSRTNNVPDNLKWGVQKENAEDRERHGRTARGSRVASAKLTEEKVAEIRLRVARGELQKHIAAELGLSKGAISHVVTRRNWRAK